MKNENKALRASWEKRISEQESSGLSRMAWCAQEGISYHKYRYWRERLVGKQPVKATTEQAIPTWLKLSPASKLPVPASDGLVVRIGEATLELQRGFDPELLREIVRALASS